MRCSKCGAEASPGGVFCGVCGKKLIRNKPIAKDSVSPKSAAPGAPEKAVADTDISFAPCGSAAGGAQGSIADIEILDIRGDAYPRRPETKPPMPGISGGVIDIDIPAAGHTESVAVSDPPADSDIASEIGEHGGAAAPREADAIVCPECGQGIPAGYKYCPNCGCPTDGPGQAGQTALEAAVPELEALEAHLRKQKAVANLTELCMRLSPEKKRIFLQKAYFQSAAAAKNTALRISQRETALEYENRRREAEERKTAEVRRQQQQREDRNNSACGWAVIITLVILLAIPGTRGLALLLGIALFFILRHNPN